MPEPYLLAFIGAGICLWGAIICIGVGVRRSRYIDSSEKNS